MFNFAENTIDMTAAEILNYYRNLYYAEPQVTERGIVANAINEYFKEAAPRAEVEYWKEQCFHACMNNGCLDKAIVKAAVAREIFEEIEEYTASWCGDYLISIEKLEELKKKYTEVQK